MQVICADEEPLFVYTWNDVRVSKIYTLFTPKSNSYSHGTRKNGPRKNGPRKNVLQKLFSVKRMLGNSNDFFIFINWFHYTQKDVYVTILHMHQTVEH